MGSESQPAWAANERFEALWFLSASDILAASMRGDDQIVRLGPRGRWVRRLLCSARRFQLDGALIIMIGLVAAFQWWLTAGRKREIFLQGPFRIFVGFGAGIEDQLWRDYAKESELPAVRMDQTKPRSFGALGRPSLRDVLREVFHQGRIASQYLSQAPIAEVQTRGSDFRAFAAMRLGQYAFNRAWWRHLSREGEPQVRFISADIPAFAAIDVGLRQVEYCQHGLLRRSLLMPRFSRMLLLTEDEADFYRMCIPGAEIRVVQHRAIRRQPVNVLLIASVYDCPGRSKSDDLSALSDLIEWAERNALKVVVRRHPREFDGFWELHFPSVSIDSGGDDIGEAIARLRPQFLVTWFSTAIFDAYLHGVKTITLCAPLDPNVQDLILDMGRYCVFWSEGREFLERVVLEQDAEFEVDPDGVEG